MSDYDNPFAALGVLQRCVDLEAVHDRPENLRVLAKGIYKVMASLYHPDKGGDPQFFAELTQARDEILDDPIALARYFKSGRSEDEKRVVRNAIAHQHRLTVREKQRLVSLLENVDPAKVAPWLVGHEAFVGNTAHGSFGDLFLSLSIGISEGFRASVGLGEHFSGKIGYSKAKSGWVISTKASERAKDVNRLVHMQRQINLLLVGGMSRADVEALQRANEERFDNPSSHFDSLEAATGSKQLQWTPSTACDWLNKLKPHPSSKDYLVIGKFGPTNVVPSLAIIGPVYKTRQLV